MFQLNEAQFGQALTDCGLPDNPTQIVGRPFLFGSSHMIAGTVTSIGYGDKEGIALYVSSPRFQGVTIRRLKYVPGVVPNVWVVESTDENADRPVGTFKLL